MSKQYLLDFIHSSGGVTSEYHLLSFVEKQHAEFFKPLGQFPSLYKKHFYLFHHLYRIRDEMLETDQSLAITSLELRICPRMSDRSELTETDALRDFYLDRENLNLTDDQVSNMLNDFWQKYLAIDEKASAIKLMGLEKNKELDLSVIKKRYNQLALQYHPDKGGKERHFIELKFAYNHLKRLYS